MILYKLLWICSVAFLVVVDKAFLNLLISWSELIVEHNSVNKPSTSLICLVKEEAINGKNLLLNIKNICPQSSSHNSISCPFFKNPLTVWIKLTDLLCSSEITNGKKLVSNSTLPPNLIGFSSYFPLVGLYPFQHPVLR